MLDLAALPSTTLGHPETSHWVKTMCPKWWWVTMGTPTLLRLEALSLMPLTNPVLTTYAPFSMTTIWRVLWIKLRWHLGLTSLTTTLRIRLTSSPTLLLGSATSVALNVSKAPKTRISFLIRMPPASQSQVALQPRQLPVTRTWISISRLLAVPSVTLRRRRGLWPRRPSRERSASVSS